MQSTSYPALSGEITLHKGRVIVWAQCQWRMTSRPWLTQRAIRLTL
nr:protein YgfX [Erwinia rhapontici]